MDEYTVDEIKDPTSLITLISMIWTAIAIFDKYDPDRYIFVILMLAGSALSLFYLLLARRTRNVFYGTPTYVYLIFFGGITAYTGKGIILSYQSYSVSLYLLEGLTVLPLLILWLIPMNTDKFFGVQSLTRLDKLNNIWKVSIIILFLVKYLGLKQNYEFLVLFPMVIEPILLGMENRGKKPLLTLQYYKELKIKFAPHISLFRTVMMIQLAFITSFLNSRGWIILLMLFITTIFLLLMASFATQLKEDKPDKSRDEIIKEVFGDESGIVDGSVSKYKAVSEGSVSGSMVTGDDLASRAYKLGSKLRTEIKKPKYNLSNILATLRDDSFENGYIVDLPNYRFESTRGMFRPRKNMVIFPIDLGKFDYRRRGEILLLGFNKPMMKRDDDNYTFKRKRMGARSMVVTNKSKSQFSMGDEFIQFKDKIFNLQTIIVPKDEWERMRSILPELSADYNISYTGFKDVAELKDVVTGIGDKWNEVREKAKITAANFIAGLIGAEDAIFYGVDDLLGTRDGSAKRLQDGSANENIVDEEDK